MRKQIILGAAQKREVAAMFKVSYPTVWAALSYKTDSGIAKTLRAAALERGGEIVGEEKPSVQFRTWFDTARGLMIQEFSERVRLVGELVSGVVRIEKDEVVQLVFENPRVSELGWIQEQAQKMVNDLK